MRKSYSVDFKARIALEAIQGEKTLSRMGLQYEVHPNQIRAWKKKLLAGMSVIFADKRCRKWNEEEDKIKLYKEIDRLKYELDWLRNKLNFSSEEKRMLIERGRSQLSISRQCELLGLSRSGYYYEPRGVSEKDR